MPTADLTKERCTICTGGQAGHALQRIITGGVSLFQRSYSILLNDTALMRLKHGILNSGMSRSRFYWKGSIEDFCKLYDYTVAGIEDVFPDARIGGPATTGPMPGSKSAEYLDVFLNHCRNGRNYVTGETGTRLDFVTFHTKGGGFFIQR